MRDKCNEGIWPKEKGTHIKIKRDLTGPWEPKRETLLLKRVTLSPLRQREERRRRRRHRQPATLVAVWDFCRPAFCVLL